MVLGPNTWDSFPVVQSIIYNLPFSIVHLHDSLLMTNYWWVIIGTMYNAQVSANWLMTTSLIIIQFRNKLINLIQTFGPKNHFSGVPWTFTRSNHFMLQLASLRSNGNWNEFRRNRASNSLETLTLCILSKSAKYATVSYMSSQPTPLSSAKTSLYLTENSMKQPLVHDFFGTIPWVLVM